MDRLDRDSAEEAKATLERWRNEHYDFDHEGVQWRGRNARPFGASNTEQCERDLRDLQSDIDQCWICHPELLSPEMRDQIAFLRDNAGSTAKTRDTSRARRQPVTAQVFADRLVAAGARVRYRGDNDFTADYGDELRDSRSVFISFHADRAPATFHYARSGFGVRLRSMAAVLRYLGIDEGIDEGAGESAARQAGRRQPS